jgi:hypothetical protein
MPMGLGRKIAPATASFALLLGIAGCSAPGFLSRGPLTSTGVPKKQYLVGGGMHIEYVAPSDGRLYWVEETTQKILAMKSVKADQEAEFGAEELANESVKKKLGVDLKDARFSLYFVPDQR